MKRTNPLTLLTGLALLGNGCGGTTTGNPTIATPDSSTSEIAASALSGAANSSEPGGSQAFYQPAPARPFWRSFSLVPNAYARTACPTLGGLHPATCSAGEIVMNYDSCTFGLSQVVWNGSQTVSFSGGACPTMTLGGLANKTLTRIFGSGTTETNILDLVTTIDTAHAASSGWDSSVPVTGEGETATFGSAGDGSRSLQILGLHLHAVTAGGKVLFDHTVSSTAMTVTGAGTSRTISSGTVTVQHNLAKFSAAAAVTTTLAYTMSGCCHPASGVITSTLSGSKTGTETLTFTGGSTGTCGSATLVDSGGATTDITLSHCF